MGEAAVSFAEIAGPWAASGIFGWACGDPGAKAGDGRGAELFSDCKCEYLRGLCEQSAKRRRDGQTTTVVPAYAGLSGFPGLHQLVFLVPDVANGDYETVLVVNGLSSPAGTYLPIGK